MFVAAVAIILITVYIRWELWAATLPWPYPRAIITQRRWEQTLSHRQSVASYGEKRHSLPGILWQMRIEKSDI